jgi:hemerythrin-like domain-containing protein
MTLPDPKHYRDAVLFFHDMHKVVLHNAAELERLLADAEASGVFQSFASHTDWEELFYFFTEVAPQHERDEERILFPALMPKLPRVGFQPPTAPIRFLVEGHDVLKTKTVRLLEDWQSFRQIKRDTDLASAHEKHQQEDAAFIRAGRDLVALYREHVALEEERVYSVAEKMLSGAEKLALMDALRNEVDEETTTTLLEFDTPQFSDPKLRSNYESTDLRSGETIEADYEDEDDEEESA